MTHPLEQFHIAYDATQDRLLLRVAGAAGEFRVWLTRRYSELLLKLLADLMDKSGGIHDIASHPDTLHLLRNDAFQQHTGPTIPVDTDEPMALGAGGILGFRINYGQDKAGITNLQLLPAQGKGLDLNLNRTTLYLLYNLLEQGVAQADWRLRLAGHHKDPVH